MRLSRYFKAVTAKYGFFMPAFIAALAFAAVFAMDYFGVMGLVAGFGHTKVLIAVLSVVILLAMLAACFKMSDTDVNYMDSLFMAGVIFAVLIIVQFCMLGFSTVKTVLIIAGAAVLLFFIIFRIFRFKETAAGEETMLEWEEKGVRTYYKNLFSHYNPIILITGGLAVFLTLFLLVNGGLLETMAAHIEVFAAVLIILAVTLLSIIAELPKRFKTQRLSVLDGAMFMADLAFLLSLITLCMNFSVILLIVWLAMMILFVLLTYLFTQKTAYEVKGRMPAGSHVKKRGVITYYRMLSRKLDPLLLTMVPVVAFYLIYAAIKSGLTASLRADSNVLLILGLCLALVIVFGIVIMQLRCENICSADALLYCADVGAVLLAAFVVFENGFSVARFYPWLICSIVCLAFTVVRWLSVYRFVPAVNSLCEEDSVQYAAAARSSDEFDLEEAAAADTAAPETADEDEANDKEEAIAETDEGEAVTRGEDPVKEVDDKTSFMPFIQPAPPSDKETPPSNSTASAEIAAAAVEPRDDNAVHEPLKRRAMSFEEKFDELPAEAKLRIDALREQAVGYRNVRLRVTRKGISVRCKREQLALIRIAGKKSLRLYLALPPDDYPQSKYHQKDMSLKRAYAGVPMMLKITSERGFKRAVQLFDALMADKQIAKKGVRRSRGLRFK